MDVTEVYRAAVETSPDGIWVVDLRGRTIYANPAVARIHGIPAEQLVRLTIFDILDESGKRQFGEHLVAVGQGELNLSDVEVKWVRDNGSIVWMLVRETPLLDESGRLYALLHRFTDYSDRHEILESLRASEDALGDQIAQNLLMQAVTSAANRARTLSDVLQQARDLVLVHDDWERARAFVPRDGELVPFYAEAEVAEADQGDPFAATELSLARRCHQTRELVWDERMLTVVFPVTLREHIYAVLAITSAPPLWRFDLIESMAKQVAHQIARVAEREEAEVELARARDQAMAASRQKSDFLATVSHEIRTPLNGVIGLNDLLLRSALDPEQHRLASGVQVASRALRDVINDVLDFSKIEAGRLELEQVDFLVRPLLDQVVGLLTETARDKGIDLVLSCHRDVPATLSGDPTRLGQVLTNLVANAVKFTERGRVQVDVRTAPASTTDSDLDVALRIEVSDTGVGVPGERLSVLFDPFTQADTSTTRRFGGTGLGLAISREIVSAMAGRLDYRPNSGGGSVFSVEVVLPRAGADAGTAAPTLEPGQQAPGGSDDDSKARRLLAGRSVLLVDDANAARQVLSDQLAYWGLVTERVGSAEEALARIVGDGVSRGEPAYDLVLVALAGAELHSVALAGGMRETGHQAVPVLVLTSARRTDTHLLRSVGVDEVLVRPVLPSQLRATLVRLVAPQAEGSARAPAPAPPYRGRILVVEDHPINQLVAEGLLAALGYTCEIAEDGLAGVEAASRGGFDAILMDVQMPRLDGYDATRRIRYGERDGTRVPVIAMTAAAIEGERERCLAVGMDDFLTKPVDAQVLGACLEVWLHPGSETPTAVGVAGPSTPVAPLPVDTVLDVHRLEELRELDTETASYVGRAVTNFLGNSVRDVSAMRISLDAGDLTALRSVAHRLAGGALNLGATRAGEALRTLEDQIRAGEVADLSRLLRTADAELAEAREALRAYLGLDPAGAA